ncbi:SMC-Scp complex subunit ScpB [Thalassotalea sp. G2M2-11]|uniref:SMC-Scp complex subunit ScpB n=1 Tax=Thalassotalea sp. G2M2-11 TaxID=2787627 RepID=UPI0019CFC5F1|nr:SMC-Scp complex subunit ScpB [Thalassotalea sp. G2M2-11]
MPTNNVASLAFKPITAEQLSQLLEAAIFSSSQPLSMKQLKQQVLGAYQVSSKDIQLAISQLQSFYQERGIELVEVASGFRFQIKMELVEDIAPLNQEKPQKYSRATLETLALIAYRQPITRGEIEDIRGVSVSSHIMKSLLEREWIKIVGHKEVPGKPSMYATTKTFLDYFGLKSLAQLPDLMPMTESTIVNDAMHDIIESQQSDTQSKETETKQ